jgi:DNA primase
VIDQAVRDRNLHRPAEKAEAAAEVLPYVRAVRGRIQKREYFDIAMEALRISDAALKRELWYTLRGPAANEGGKVRQKVLGRSGAKPTVAEQRLLELLFADEALRRVILPRLDATEYEELPTAAIFQALIAIQNEGTVLDFSNLSQKTAADTLAAELLPLLLMSESADNEDADSRLADAERCVDTLRLMKVDRRIDELKAELSAVEREGNTEGLDQLVNEQIELTRQRSALLPRAEAAPTGH